MPSPKFPICLSVPANLACMLSFSYPMWNPSVDLSAGSMSIMILIWSGSHLISFHWVRKPARSLAEFSFSWVSAVMPIGSRRHALSWQGPYNLHADASRRWCAFLHDAHARTLSSTLRIQIIQIGIASLICTGVWSNLFVNMEKNKPPPKESKPTPGESTPRMSHVNNK